MKSTILIARIMRVIETEGMLGEGASLAEAYADAVRKVPRVCWMNSMRLTSIVCQTGKHCASGRDGNIRFHLIAP